MGVKWEINMEYHKFMHANHDVFANLNFSVRHDSETKETLI